MEEITTPFRLFEFVWMLFGLWNTGMVFQWLMVHRQTLNRKPWTDKPWTDKPWTDKPQTDKPLTRQTLDTTNPGHDKPWT
jgi:hypothetical protein